MGGHHLPRSFTKPHRSSRSATGYRVRSSGPAAIDETTSFIGRVDDIAGAAAALSEARLLTLTGVGGVGKTRLAARVAIAVSDRFADGVSWCELAPLTDPAAVAPALATSLGVRRQPDAGVVDSIADFLAPKRLLLVLDNCEHVLDGVRPLVEAILRACPRVVVLATSRERLAIKGERVQPVGRLPLPDTERPLDATAPAVALFVDRARAVRPDLDLGAVNLAAIVDMCRDLDGLPLSLELAAARIRSLNPVDLAARMAGRLDLLSPADADAGRHSTLRAVLDWSYNLLTPTQRRLFDRLSVFSGSFDLAAAEAVGSGDGIGRGQLVDLLASLVDASMISVGSYRREGPLLACWRRCGATEQSIWAPAVRPTRFASDTLATTRRSPNRQTAVFVARTRPVGHDCRPGAGQSSCCPSVVGPIGPSGAGPAALVRAALLHAVQVPRRGRLLGPGDPRSPWRGPASAVRGGVWRSRRGPDGARGDGPGGEPRRPGAGQSVDPTTYGACTGFGSAG